MPTRSRSAAFVVGIDVLTAASLLAGLAQSPAWLLAARAAQGVGAAIAAQARSDRPVEVTD
jgi:MFS family permease